MNPDAIREIIQRLEREQDDLERLGYSFPALYAAVIALIKQQMPE